MYTYPAQEWFALMVKPRFEKSTSTLLRQKGYEEFLPLTAEARSWSDRVKTVQLPLFPRYVFCCFNSHQQGPILNTPGVQRIVGFGMGPTPIPDHEINSLRKLMESGSSPAVCDYIADGEWVLVREGPLAGMEGLLVKAKGSCRVVVSIHLLQRSVYVEVDRTAIVASRIPSPLMERVG
jgi:transcription antitermination factor NusG